MDRLLRPLFVVLIGMTLASCVERAPRGPDSDSGRASRQDSAECLGCKSTGQRMSECEEPYNRCRSRCPREIPRGGGKDTCGMNCTMEHSRCISNASVPNCPAACR